MKLTFVGVLSACPHSGFVDEGCKWFKIMKLVHGFEPKVEHYGCMVDLLGQAGLLDEVKELIEAMDVNSSVPMWGLYLVLVVGLVMLRLVNMQHNII